MFVSRELKKGLHIDVLFKVSLCRLLTFIEDYNKTCYFITQSDALQNVATDF